ncbi:MAG: ABC transporter ATP-binding protein [Nitrospinota bacterium]
MAKIRFEHIWKRYGRVEAVKDLNLDCEEGEFLALLGPSGCGKTSSLRMLAGLEIISEGDLFIGDRRINDVPSKDRDIAMVFEDYALYPHLTVYNNIAFPLKIRKMERSVIKQRVQRALEMLGLQSIRDENVQRLSGGAQQRISIGRAIVREPQVLLMDEPISHLDSAHKVELRGELKRLQRNLGVSTVYVTHDQVEATALADRVAVMNLGVLQQVGPPEDLYDRPANLFVAGFIGEPPMNFIRCEADSGGGRLRGPDFELPISHGLMQRISDHKGSRLTLGIRPASLRINKSPSDSQLRGNVFAVEPRGDSAVVMVEMGEHRLLSESAQNLGLQEDAVVGLSFPEDHLHLFDTETGVNLTAKAGGL